ncbi:hypothetical protein V8G54_026323 [Vigna mungo]|uniref:Uncharacterized protein n=1 Tax=Vigna mungo TaxID=3915 RepID=A0AAQ3MZW5_VIGMU
MEKEGSSGLTTPPLPHPNRFLCSPTTLILPLTIQRPLPIYFLLENDINLFFSPSSFGLHSFPVKTMPSSPTGDSGREFEGENGVDDTGNVGGLGRCTDKHLQRRRCDSQRPAGSVAGGDCGGIRRH